MWKLQICSLQPVSEPRAKINLNSDRQMFLLRRPWRFSHLNIRGSFVKCFVFLTPFPADKSGVWWGGELRDGGDLQKAPAENPLPSVHLQLLCFRGRTNNTSAHPAKAEGEKHWLQVFTATKSWLTGFLVCFPPENIWVLKPLLPCSPHRTLSKTIVKGAKMAGKITMGRGSQTTLKKADRGSRMTWHEDDDISSERKWHIKGLEKYFSPQNPQLI